MGEAALDREERAVQETTLIRGDAFARLFEPIWNRRYVDHVQITVAEDLGVEGRGFRSAA